MSDTAPRDPLLLLVAYADGELDADTTATVEALLTTRADLRNRCDDIRSLQAGLRARLPAAPRELDYSHWRAVMAAAEPLSTRSWWTTARVMAAAVLVVGVTFGALAVSTLTVYSTKEELEEPAIKTTSLSPASARYPSSAPDNTLMRGIYLTESPVEEFSSYEENDSDMPKGREEAKSNNGPELGWSGVTRKAKEGNEDRLAQKPSDGDSFAGRARPEKLVEKQEALKRIDVASAGKKSTQDVKDRQQDAPKQRQPQQAAQERLRDKADQGGKNIDDALEQLGQLQTVNAQEEQELARLDDREKNPVLWRANLTGADLADKSLARLDSLQKALDQERNPQIYNEIYDDKTINLDLSRLSRGQGLLQTARAGGRQLRLVPEGVEVAPERIPLDPTTTFGLSRTDFQAAFATVPMVMTAETAKLTFAFTADTASFDRASSQLLSGQAIDPLAIRAEHFINAVPADYPAATGTEAFALYAEAGPSPFAAGSLAVRTALVSVGAVARPAGAEERRPLALTVAIDCSGSMAQPGGLDRVRVGLHELLLRLNDDDSLAVVAFGDRARVVLPATPGSERERIAAAIAAIQTGGSTNAGEGLNLAYQLAAETAQPGRESRVMLATDGATLAGDGASPVLERIAAYRARGITLVVVGCGGQQYQGAALDALAAKGDGQHVYVGSDDEARALFRDKLVPARLGVLARDAKVQVIWNPQRVTHARLIGFETRRLEDRDFRNDAIDAGELSQDSQATALFEVVLADGGSGALGTAAVRYLDTRLGTVREITCPLPGSLVKNRPSQRLRLLACSATLADLLSRSWWANQRCATYAGLLDYLSHCEPSPFRDHVRNMAQAAQRLTREP